MTQRFYPRDILEKRTLMLGHLRSQAARILRLSRLFASHGLPMTLNDWRLAALRNRHIGKRCFIVGSGPSLRVSDLDRLRDEITFSSNQVFVVFKQTEWRPTYYTVVDRLIGQNFAKEIVDVQAIKLLPDFMRGVVKSDRRTMFYLHDVKRDAEGRHIPAFSINALDRVYGGHTITYVNMQLAFYMGVQTVFLVGIDHNYAVPRGSAKPGEVAVHQGEQTHFHPDYFRPGDSYIVPDFAKHEESYREAKRVYEQHGRAIYNATRGGMLEIFPRVSLDDVLATPDSWLSSRC
jgi:hypothetical protein